jgi:hypothetical protein
MAHGEIAIPQFANSIQRMVEVFVETVAGEIKDIQMRPTYARFDREGKVDLRDAVEAWAIFLEGSSPKHLSDKVVDIRPTLEAKRVERDTAWRITGSVKRAILADLRGDAKLPLLKFSN